MVKIGSETCGFLFTLTNTFNNIFKKYIKNFELIDNDECDFIIKAPLSGEVWNCKNKPYIYWSGESFSVPKSKYQTDFIQIESFITDKENILYVPFCLESNFIYKERINTNLNREFTIGYCASNTIEFREHFFNKCVEKIGINQCISFGSCFGNYKNTNQRIGGDFQGIGLIQNYSKCKFIMAFENKIKNGYITEKIVNAFYSGTIPVYWGSENIGDFFNKKAFINVNDFESIEKCIDYIFNLTDIDREKILKEPIYTNNELINLNNDNFNSLNENKILKKYDNIIKNFLVKNKIIDFPH